CFDVAYTDVHAFPTRRASDLTNHHDVVNSEWFVFVPLTKRYCNNGTGNSSWSSDVTFLITPRNIFENLRIYFKIIRNRIPVFARSEEHTSELQSRENIVCRHL